MIRKLIQLSPSTSVISLPTAWLKENNLSKGSELHLKPEGNSILIKTEKQNQETSTTINIKEFQSKIMWARIDTAYCAGFDEIHVQCKDTKQANYMTTISRYFLGMIVSNQIGNNITLKCLSKHTQKDLESTLSRIFTLILALNTTSIEAIQKKDYKSLIDMKKKDYTINSYISCCIRTINKTGYNHNKIGAFHTFLKLLEMLSDKYCTLWVTIGRNQLTLPTQLCNNITKIFESFRKAHYKFSEKTILELDTARQNLSKTISENKDIQYLLKDIAQLYFELTELLLQLNTKQTANNNKTTILH